MAKEENRTHRAAKRYSYSVPASCAVNQQTCQVQILNISTSGIQFSSEVDIDSNDPLTLSWVDSNLGQFETSVIITRRNKQSTTKGEQNFFGSQYTNLSQQNKEELVKLLKKVKEVEKEKINNDIEKLTADYLFLAIDRGKDFLKDIFTTTQSVPHLQSIVAEIKDYERVSFSSNDPSSVYIQDLTTYSFDCHLLELLIPFVYEKPQLKVRFFEQIVVNLEMITQAEMNADPVIKEILSNNVDPDSTKNLQRIINESSNRLFYSKHSLLKQVAESFEVSELDSAETKAFLNTIAGEYEKIIAITSTAPESDINYQYKRKTKLGPAAATHVQIKNMATLSEKKPSALLWINCTLLFLFFAGFGAYKLVVTQELNALEERLSLPIEIQKYNRAGKQLRLTVSKSDWEKVPDVEKTKIYQTVIDFLRKDKDLEFCLFAVSGKGIVKMLNDETGLGDSPES